MNISGIKVRCLYPVPEENGFYAPWDKICTYSCIYCQLGRAVKVQAKRQEFYDPTELLEETKRILSSIHHKEEYPDYITIVPDGEPTLDSNLDILIKKLQTLKIPVAVISNASLTHLPEVRDALLQADYVSLKIDTVNEETWRKINKPHRSLRLDEIFSGIRSFDLIQKTYYGGYTYYLRKFRK